MDSQGKRIARNIVYLYIRMGVMMLVRLYTVRVVLSILGIDDYGLWNVIMAFVTSLAFVSPLLVTASQRFLTTDMGRGGDNLTKIFTASSLLFGVAALLFTVFLESAGLWFVNNRMNIPPGMETQAAVVYQFCILTIIADMARMPSESAIVASEKMGFYAVVCVAEAVLLLGIVFLLPLFPAGVRLISYGALTLAAHVGISAIYIVYCRQRFSFARLRRFSDRQLLRNMLCFSGWSVLDAASSILALQGVDVLMNVYFGVEANAAYGVGTQVRTAILVFISNISKAASPGIMKSLAAGKTAEMKQLVLNTSRFTFMLILLFALPMMFYIEPLLHLWLDTVPPEAPAFCVPILLQLLLVSVNSPMDAAIYATGNIRKFEICISLTILLNFIFSWVAYGFGAAAVSALWIRVGVEVLVLTVRVVFLRREVRIRSGEVVSGIFLPCLRVMAIASAVMAVLYNLTRSLPPAGATAVGSAAFLIIYVAVAFAAGLNASQRTQITSKLKTILQNRTK